MTQKQSKERIPLSTSLYGKLKRNCPAGMSVDQFTEHLLKNAIEHRRLLADALNAEV